MSPHQPPQTPPDHLPLGAYSLSELAVILLSSARAGDIPAVGVLAHHIGRRVGDDRPRRPGKGATDAR